MFNALRGLSLVHQLPKTQRVHQLQRRDGRTLVFIQVSAADGEVWREALGAPAFEPHDQPLGVQYTTERVSSASATVAALLSVGDRVRLVTPAAGASSSCRPAAG